MRATDRPFCVDLVLDSSGTSALRSRSKIACRGCRSHLGCVPNCLPARAGGARVLFQVASAHAARAAPDAGADALVVQGVEAGGQVKSVVGLLPMIVAVRRPVSLPLVAAGGIADPASACAALVAGAAAGAMRTRFVASDECDAHPRYKAGLLEAEGRDTVLTELFDVGWPAPQRMLRNSTCERWEAGGCRRQGAGRARARRLPRHTALRGQHAPCGRRGRHRGDGMYAGQEELPNGHAPGLIPSRLRGMEVGGLVFASCLTWSTRSAKKSIFVLRSCGLSREKRATYNAPLTHSTDCLRQPRPTVAVDAGSPLGAHRGHVPVQPAGMSEHSSSST
jgi:hypothetical protein